MNGTAKERRGKKKQVLNAEGKKHKNVLSAEVCKLT